MIDVTGEEVKTAMVAAGIDRADMRDCSMCGYPLAYIRQGDRIGFDPGCYCSGGGGVEERSWSEAADAINIQSQLKWRNEMRAKFGLPPDPTKETP